MTRKKDLGRGKKGGGCTREGNLERERKARGGVGMERDRESQRERDRQMEIDLVCSAGGLNNGLIRHLYT